MISIATASSSSDSTTVEPSDEDLEASESDELELSELQEESALSTSWILGYVGLKNLLSVHGDNESSSLRMNF